MSVWTMDLEAYYRHRMEQAEEQAREASASAAGWRRLLNAHTSGSGATRGAEGTGMTPGRCGAWWRGGAGGSTVSEQERNRRDKARGVKCPACGAQPWKDCRSITDGQASPLIHRSRVDAWKAAAARMRELAP